MTEAESKIIIDHIHWKMEDGDGDDRDLNFSYDFDHDGETVCVTWWDDEGETLRTETYRLDIKLTKESRG